MALIAMFKIIYDGQTNNRLRRTVIILYTDMNYQQLKYFRLEMPNINMILSIRLYIQGF